MAPLTDEEKGKGKGRILNREEKGKGVGLYNTLI